MKRYGYLGKPSSSESLVTEDAVINGLMKLQTFARLPATGKIDAATIKVLNKIFLHPAFENLCSDHHISSRKTNYEFSIIRLIEEKTITNQQTRLVLIVYKCFENSEFVFCENM